MKRAKEQHGRPGLERLGSLVGSFAPSLPTSEASAVEVVRVARCRTGGQGIPFAGSRRDRLDDPRGLHSAQRYRSTMTHLCARIIRR